jgi:hypothetical protein
MLKKKTTINLASAPAGSGEIPVKIVVVDRSR